MHALTVVAMGVASALLSLSAAAQMDCAAASAAVIPLPVQVSNVAIPNSRSNPQINQRHIFCGEINAAGNAVGFHSRPGNHDPLVGPLALDPVAARTIGPRTYMVPYGLNQPNDYRYANANVEVFNVATGTWVAKAGPSTFFPDSCTQQQVVASIRYAFMHLSSGLVMGGGNSQIFFGPSAPTVIAVVPNPYCVDEQGLAFTVGGYLNGIPPAPGAALVWWGSSAFPIAAF